SEFSSGKGWEPIGETDGDGYADSEYFSGSFNGNGYTISNLYVNRPEKGRTGLFGYVNLARGNSINDVNLQDAVVIGSVSAGSLIGEIVSGNAVECTVNYSNIRGTENIGGLIGKASNSTILHGYARNVYIGLNPSYNRAVNVGGLVGTSLEANITYCLTEGMIVGLQKVGGLIGYVRGGSILKSVSWVSYVEAQDTVGGLIGDVYTGSIEECSAHSSVVGDSIVGGLVGKTSFRYTSIRFCSATGSVTGGGLHGGLVGLHGGGVITTSFSRGTVTTTPDGWGGGGLVGGIWNMPSIDNSYYDSTTSGRTDVGKGFPRTADQMRMQSTFIGWDFTNIWVMGPSFPILRNILSLY
ncbi:MAG TPA: hypothetical protein PK717_06565, partial [Caldisericia bacterium]|nr:hypothetical protein [Caldisericia bacterium]